MTINTHGLLGSTNCTDSTKHNLPLRINDAIAFIKQHQAPAANNIKHKKGSE